jgi:hypothetical protein
MVGKRVCKQTAVRKRMGKPARRGIAEAARVTADQATVDGALREPGSTPCGVLRVVWLRREKGDQYAAPFYYWGSARCLRD